MSSLSEPRPAPPEEPVERDGAVTNEAGKLKPGYFGFAKDSRAKGYALASKPTLGGRLVRESELRRRGES